MRFELSEISSRGSVQQAPIFRGMPRDEEDDKNDKKEAEQIVRQRRSFMEMRLCSPFLSDSELTARPSYLQRSLAWATT